MYREDLNAIIIEEIAAAAQCHDVNPEQARAMARTVENRLRQRVGGSEIRYVRKRDNAVRDDQIRREFTGDNIADLARQHELSERRIRQILDHL